MPSSIAGAGRGTQEELVPEALRRANAYVEAGVDCVYPIALGDRRAAPLHLGGPRPHHPAQELLVERRELRVGHGHEDPGQDQAVLEGLEEDVGEALGRGLQGGLAAQLILDPALEGVQDLRRHFGESQRGLSAF